VNAAVARRWSGRAGVIALVVALAAAITAALVWRQRARVDTRVVERAAIVVPGRVAADACPFGVVCVAGPLRPAVLTGLAAAFPGATVVDSYAVLSEEGVRYREIVHARTLDGVLVDLAVQEIPGTEPIGRVEPIDPPATGPAQLEWATPVGAAGSVVIALRVPAGRAVPAQSASRLATDPRLAFGG
jgi:hypothetical protein